jgi:hypothetical protein
MIINNAKNFKGRGNPAFKYIVTVFDLIYKVNEESVLF